MNPLIVSAISNRLVIELGYDAAQPGAEPGFQPTHQKHTHQADLEARGGLLRLVEPHAYGEDQAGLASILAWQTSGPSTGGASVGWKFLHARHITHLRVLRERSFWPRPAFSRNDKRFRTTYAQV